ncbi:PREDICTED: protein TIFY 8-like [Ipomoea nil]|uniref:protein TIFY 8-like n=1 Tax=Ipomoea nil TaxID=35883 RepID=UPI000900EF96|nr:PREDICTED: protein TIFY 8-like [Ipomoea nil]
MAQPNTNANTKIPANAAEEVKGSTVFHDFLGKGCAPDSSPAPPATSRPPLEPSSGGGGCGPVSTTSDMCSGPEASFRFSGSKRCSSDSNHSIMGSCKDRFPGVQPDSLATSHVMKLLRGAGGERPRGPPYNEEPSLGVHPMRPLSSSSLSMGARAYANTSKWDRVPISATPTLQQYPPHATSQAVSFGYQAPPANRFRDNNAGPSVISQAAADEGSRTGIKGSGILRSINTSAGMSDRTLSGVPLSGCKPSFGVQSSEPESSNPSRQGVGFAGHQMTIFYGGQAHVFDDVHPNKADLIMALAGSNGGSWSTTYAPKSAGRVSGEKNVVPAGENETGAGSGSAILRELQGRASLRVGSSRPFVSGDQSFLPPGNHQGGSMSKETRTAVQVAEALNEEKNDV